MESEFSSIINLCDIHASCLRPLSSIRKLHSLSFDTQQGIGTLKLVSLYVADRYDQLTAAIAQHSAVRPDFAHVASNFLTVLGLPALEPAEESNRR